MKRVTVEMGDFPQAQIVASRKVNRRRAWLGASEETSPLVMQFNTARQKSVVLEKKAWC